MPGPGGGGHGGGGHGGGGHGGGGFGGGHGGGGFGGGHGGGGFGGGHGGGGFGGGPHGGGFGGGPHGPHGPHGPYGFGGGPRPPRGPHWGGWWGRGPRRYGGGGCLSFLLVPIILVIVVVIIFSSVFSSAFLSLSGKGGISYDENTFGDYADEQYMAEFGSSTAYEDNLLIVFLTNEECDEYYYISWLGDHLEAPIYNMFGDNYSEFGRVVNAAINSASYKYSLDSNLAAVISKTEEKITAFGLDSSFTCSENHVQVTSHITNKTDLPITEATVNAALEKFTENTGIPVVIVVEDMTEVFPTYVSVGSIVFLIIFVVLIAVVIYFIVRNVRKRKEDEYYNN